jgi:hypothetical protein
MNDGREFERTEGTEDDIHGGLFPQGDAPDTILSVCVARAHQQLKKHISLLR